jgi:shikimate dehydrogenase
MYEAAFRALGVDAAYTARSVTTAELPGAMRRIADGGGGNVTLPHKRHAAALLDAASSSVGRSGACNCFWGARDGSLIGDNTDIGGFLRAVRRLLEDSETRLKGARTLVLGAGGAARAVLTGLDEGGASRAEVLNRTRLGAEELLEELRFETLQATVLVDADEATGPYDLVVNATSLGLRPSDPLPLDLSRVAVAAVFDCVYGRNGTAWTRHAAAAGLRASDGLEMLVEQGRISVRNWLGVEPSPDLMRRAALAALAGS